MRYTHIPKYAIGDILFNLAADSHLLIEDIKIVHKDPWYCTRQLEDGILTEYRIKPFDNYAHIIKVA